jgi:hypothetical protein
MGISRPIAAIAACLLLALMLGYYILSPFVFLRTLASDAKHGNGDALALEVDFPSVRAGMDEQLDAVLAARAERSRSRRKNGFDKAIQAFLPSLGHQVINSIVTPDGVATLLRQHVKPAGDGTGRPSLWQGHLSWLSPNRVRVTYANARHPALPFSMELERQKLFDWRVSQLNLPLKEVVGPDP